MKTTSDETKTEPQACLYFVRRLNTVYFVHQLFTMKTQTSGETKPNHKHVCLLDGGNAYKMALGGGGGGGAVIPTVFLSDLKINK